MRRGSKLHICYRAEADALSAYRLYRALKGRFGDKRLFIEREPLLNGDKGRQPSLKALAEARAALLCVGEGWKAPEPGFTTINDPEDFLAQELREALRRGLAVIPVCLEDAAAPSPLEVPEDLADIFEVEPLRLRDSKRVADMAAIEKAVGDALRGRPAWAGRRAGASSSGSAFPAALRSALSASLMAVQLAVVAGAGWLAVRGGADRSAAASAAMHRPATTPAFGADKRALDEGEPARRRTEPERTEPARKAAALEDEDARDAAEAAAREARRVQADDSDVKPADDVRRLQPAILAELRRQGALPETQSASWSAAVEQAVMPYQEAAGLERNGAPSAALLEHLRRAHPFEQALRGSALGEALRECAECPAMVRVPEGSFLMGSGKKEPERETNEGPRRRVTLSAFAIGRTEVTFAEWDACAEDGFCRPVPSGGPRDNDTDRGWGREDRPVIEVSWADVTGDGEADRGFIAWLNSKVAGDPYRLPTEAEWEYAARAGSKGPFWWGAKISPDQANYKGSSTYRGGGSKGVFRGKTEPVASFEPNKFGLYQVHGNVWEWVQDCWHDDYEHAPSDGAAWMDENSGDCLSATLRGGAWSAAPGGLRAANRVRGRRTVRDVAVGFRIARSLEPRDGGEAAQP